ncbi:MAG: 50S ribosomal protein L11 methyltransferase [Thermoanaerobaculia bacterium]
MSWLRLTLRVASEREEELAAALWQAGTLGLEIRPLPAGRVEVDAYFRDPPPAEVALLDAAAWLRHDAELVTRQALPPTDWLARYRELAVPFALGRGFLVDPRDASAGAWRGEGGEGRIRLRIPARTAFGIGSHESTRLAVELLEAVPPAGLDVLDVGTGTGILALVALRLGARSAVGIDLDSGAALVARDTARCNGLMPRLAAASLAALGPGARFDLAVVNIIPAEWLASAEAVVARLSRAGALLTSGLLVGQQAMVRDRLLALGLAVEQERRDGEWLALRLARA